MTRLLNRQPATSLLIMVSFLCGAPALSSEKAGVGAEGAAAETPHMAKVHCVDPHACCTESEKVIQTLNTMIEALSKKDFATYEEYLDEGCTTFDEGTKKLIAGKQAVVTEMKRKLEELSPEGATPLLSYTIDHPYAKVTGNTAVVTFTAYKEIGGKHPYKARCHATDIFVKHGDKWKKLHYRGRWQKIS